MAVLNEVRRGVLSDAALKLLTGPECGTLLSSNTSGIEPTVLYAKCVLIFSRGGR